MAQGYVQDVLTRIINVSWGGGAVFVMGDVDGQIWYSDGKGSTDMEFQKVFVIGTAHRRVPPGQCNGSSYALVTVEDVTGEETQIPAFLVGGFEHAYDRTGAAGEEVGHFTIGKIMHSSDGLAWDEVFDIGGGLTEPTSVEKIIWDAGQFYSLVSRAAADNLTSECWSSANGKDWGMISSEPGGSNPDFESHCKYKDVNTGDGLPDGQFDVDPAKKGSDETFPYGEVVEDGLLITKDDMNNCPVAFAGNVWGRANFTNTDAGELETSTDSGATWTVVGHVIPYDADDPRSGAIRTLIAAPSQDIE